MSNEFVIDTGKDRRVIFEALKRCDAGYLELYRVTLESPLMHASTDVYNSPYRIFLNDYFQDLANFWNGWEGKKECEAIEGEIHLAATISKLGHVNLEITLNIYGYPSDWVAFAKLDIEAGQLDKIAKEAKLFFTGYA